MPIMMEKKRLCIVGCYHCQVNALTNVRTCYLILGSTWECDKALIWGWVGGGGGGMSTTRILSVSH